MAIMYPQEFWPLLAQAGTTLVEATAQNWLFVGIDNDPDEVTKAQGWLSELRLA